MKEKDRRLMIKLGIHSSIEFMGGGGIHMFGGKFIYWVIYCLLV